MGSLLYIYTNFIFPTSHFSYQPNKSFSFLHFSILTTKKKKGRKLGPCLDAYFSSLKFRYSSLITHHSSLITLKYHTCLALSLSYHHSIFFTLFVGLIPVTWCSFFFFSFLVPRNPNQKGGKKRTQKLEPSERRRKKKEKKKKKEEHLRLNPREKRKKKKARTKKKTP